MKILATMTLAVFLLSAALVTAKVLLEHHCAPSSRGIKGELQQRPIDIVLLGSSHSRQGYDAALLEQVTGRRVFVVSYDGLDLTSMSVLARAVLRDPAKRPSVLVIEAYPANLAVPPELEDPRLFFDSPPAVKLSLVRRYLHAHHRAGDYLDMWTLAANRGSDQILTYPLIHGAIDNLSYHGSYKGKAVAGVTAETLATFHVPVYGSVADPDQLAAFREIVTVAAASHVSLIAADPPMPASVEAQPDMTALRNQFRTLTLDANIPFYEGADDFPLQDPALFHDSNHLSAAGRDLYTRRFAQALMNGLMH